MDFDIDDLKVGKDLEPFLALNNAHAVELSFADAARFRELVGDASVSLMVADPLAFLLAFDQSARCDGPNYDWFHGRYERFLYVDRVVVSEAGRGRGIARALYDRVLAEARARGCERVCAEVNVDPPNVASDRFHERHGFVEVGRARLADRGKTVRYLCRALDGADRETG